LNVRGLFTSGRMSDFWSVLREVDPQNVIREADHPLRLIVCGAPGVGKQTLATHLIGGTYVRPASPNVAIDVCDMPTDVPVALPSADLYLYVASADDVLGAVQRGHLAQLSRRSGRVVCALNRRTDPDSPRPQQVQQVAGAALGIGPERVYCAAAADRLSVERELVPGLVREIPHLALPLGRALEAFREPAADHVISDTARINAEFALISALPALVPVVGSLASAGTDMIVLTKNQVMLLLKLALLYRRPIDNRMQVLAEVAPVIGAGFFWRSAARSLVALVPGPFGLAPRAAVAYLGTYVTGKAGQHYYRWGHRPSSDVLDSFREEALRHLADLTPMIAQVGRRLRLP